MYAVEFDASIREGIIEIPVELRETLHDRVRVILLSEAGVATDRSRLARLMANPKKIEGFRPMSRDEIYDR